MIWCRRERGERGSKRAHVQRPRGTRGTPGGHAEPGRQELLEDERTSLYFAMCEIFQRVEESCVRGYISGVSGIPRWVSWRRRGEQGLRGTPLTSERSGSREAARKETEQHLDFFHQKKMHRWGGGGGRAGGSENISNSFHACGQAHVCLVSLREKADCW